jgi:hypothetical protein
MVQDQTIAVHERSGSHVPLWGGIGQQRHVVIRDLRRACKDVGSRVEFVGAPEIDHGAHAVVE